MSNVLYYDLAKNTSENEEALRRITDWWNNQGGKRFKQQDITHGTVNSPSTEIKLMQKNVDPFASVITEPKLENGTLSFKRRNELMNFPVKKLELDTQKQELKVFYSDEFPNSCCILSLDE